MSARRIKKTPELPVELLRPIFRYALDLLPLRQEPDSLYEIRCRPKMPSKQSWLAKCVCLLNKEWNVIGEGWLYDDVQISWNPSTMALFLHAYIDCPRLAEKAKKTKVISLRGQDGTPPEGAELLRLAQRFPRLERLMCYDLYWSLSYRDMATIGMPASLRHVNVTRSTNDELCWFILACPQLETFRSAAHYRNEYDHDGLIAREGMEEHLRSRSLQSIQVSLHPPAEHDDAETNYDEDWQRDPNAGFYRILRTQSSHIRFIGLNDINDTDVWELSREEEGVRPQYVQLKHLRLSQYGIDDHRSGFVLDRRLDRCPALEHLEMDLLNRKWTAEHWSELFRYVMAAPALRRLSLKIDVLLWNSGNEADLRDAEEQLGVLESLCASRDIRCDTATDVKRLKRS